MKKKMTQFYQFSKSAVTLTNVRFWSPEFLEDKGFGKKYVGKLMDHCCYATPV
jgi:hypothetical protein